ncbi:MAG: DNA modification methylase [Candidatus Tokpelaia sp. JSC189]|nr:MAG: DNA modification methylase [Candidatus Tokpelaia sp. JSC189]
MEGLYVANCIHYMNTMPDECVNWVVTLPPYDDLRDYNGYSFKFEEIALELYRVIKKGGVVVWNVMIYQKNTPSMRSNAYTNCYEFMLVHNKNQME